MPARVFATQLDYSSLGNVDIKGVVRTLLNI